jgi:hypothetical protein
VISQPVSLFGVSGAAGRTIHGSPPSLLAPAAITRRV